MADQEKPAKNIWTEPSTLISIVTALVAIGGMYINYQNSNINYQNVKVASEKQQEEIDQLRDQWNEQMSRREEVIRDYDIRIDRIQFKLDVCRRENGVDQYGRNAMGMRVYDPCQDLVKEKEEAEDKKREFLASISK